MQKQDGPVFRRCVKLCSASKIDMIYNDWIREDNMINKWTLWPIKRYLFNIQLGCQFFPNLSSSLTPPHSLSPFTHSKYHSSPRHCVFYLTNYNSQSDFLFVPFKISRLIRFVGFLPICMLLSEVCRWCDLQNEFLTTFFK